MKLKHLIISCLFIIPLAFVMFIIFKPTPTVDVKVWLSNVNSTDTGMDKALTQQVDIKFSKVNNKLDYVINIDEKKKYQQMDGFGASFTEASAWLTNEKLKQPARDLLMKKLFDKDTGIGISLLRQPIGACDHVLSPYNYDENPDDDTLSHFSIAHDEKCIIPAIKQALSINPGRIKVMAATWSPPSWMKSNDSELGMNFGMTGTLLPDKYDAYANYFVKYIQEYKKAGIPIYATTIQNEPLYASSQWPAMSFGPLEEAKFIKNNLVPAFKKNGIDTKIICYDHNWDFGKYYIKVIYKDPEVNKYVDGSAWHWYGGDEEEMTKAHDLYPDKGIWFTEGSGGEWGRSKKWKSGFLEGMKYLVRIPRNWSKSVIWWNVALDETNGPDYYYTKYMKVHSTCRGLVTIDKNTAQISYNLDYYTIGHASKFVDPGAYRIDSNTYKDELEDVAFKNPDGSTALIVFNPSSVEKTFAVKWGKRTFNYTLPKETAATFKWTEE